MKKIFPIIFTTAIIFLFFIQTAGVLVESIYIQDLLNSSLDAKVLGVLFFFAPLLLVFFKKPLPKWLIWSLLVLLVAGRGLLAFPVTAVRMLAAGVGVGSALLLFPSLIAAKVKGDPRQKSGIEAAIGLALAIALSTLLRTLNSSIDYSLTAPGIWVGWALGLLLGWLVAQLEWEDGERASLAGKSEAKSKAALQDKAALQNKAALKDKAARKGGAIPSVKGNNAGQGKKSKKPLPPESAHPVTGSTSALLGVVLLLTLAYFAFSAPAVIARWTEGNYTLIVSAVSLLSLGWALLALSNPGYLGRISRSGLAVWNVLFSVSLVWTLLAHRVSFPSSATSEAVVAGTPGLGQQVPLVLMLLLFPVIFFDMRLFWGNLQRANPSPRQAAGGLLWGALALVLLVFMNIFTNVWGYVRPISPFFRNKYWLPFLLIAGAITLLGALQQREAPVGRKGLHGRALWGWAALLALVFAGTLVGALPKKVYNAGELDRSSLIAMTYNMQQANDMYGEKSYPQQLALFREVMPDILALQESDSARISLNNNDYVRYYADKLGYYSYYGPTPLTGTYGSAILSRYKLENTRAIFSYSDKDETGTAAAEIEVGGRRFSIYSVHPDSSDEAMVVFAQDLLKQAAGKENVIALGDYNLRDYEEAYQIVDAALKNAWTDIYPSEIGADGTDMSGDNRIDHIFVSETLGVRNAIYLLRPESATDHPAHWTEVFWEE